MMGVFEGVWRGTHNQDTPKDEAHGGGGAQRQGGNQTPQAVRRRRDVFVRHPRRRQNLAPEVPRRGQGKALGARKIPRRQLEKSP